MRARWAAAVIALVIFPLAAFADPVAPGARMRCGVNDYGWPLSSDTAPLGTGTGTLEIVADGHGNYTSGQMTEQLADDTHALGTNVCTFDLVRGTYEKKADGTIANTMIWKLRSGSDPHCGAMVTGAKNLGYVASARDFREPPRPMFWLMAEPSLLLPIHSGWRLEHVIRSTIEARSLE
jgi:hypothetical protein